MGDTAGHSRWPSPSPLTQRHRRAVALRASDCPIHRSAWKAYSEESGGGWWGMGGISCGYAGGGGAAGSPKSAPGREARVTASGRVLADSRLHSLVRPLYQAARAATGTKERGGGGEARSLALVYQQRCPRPSPGCYMRIGRTYGRDEGGGVKGEVVTDYLP
jgi:hypothetical protein